MAYLGSFPEDKYTTGVQVKSILHAPFPPPDTSVTYVKAERNTGATCS